MERKGNSKIPLPIKGISCQDLLHYRNVVHSGYLRRRHVTNKVLDTLSKSSKVLDTLSKSSVIPKWPNCYVVLHDGCIYVYNNERSATAKKACSLYGYMELRECDESEMSGSVSWAFRLASELDLNSPVMYFSAPTHADMKKWMDCIRKQMNYANNFRSGGEKASSASSSTTAVSAVVSPKPVAAAAVAAAAAIPITPITRTPPADHCKPVLKVKPKKASIPPPLPPRKFPRDEDVDVNTEYDQLSDEGSMLSPLTISDKPQPRDKHPRVSSGRSQEENTNPSDYLLPVEYEDNNDTSRFSDEEAADYWTNEEYRTFVDAPELTQEAPGYYTPDEIQNDTGVDTLIQKAVWCGVQSEGEKLMRSITDDGVFMIRASTESGKETMLVQSGGEVRKYHIMISEEDRYSLVKTGPFFDTKNELVKFYIDKPLPLRTGKLIKLTKPYTDLGYANR